MFSGRLILQLIAWAQKYGMSLGELIGIFASGAPLPTGLGGPATLPAAAAAATGGMVWTEEECKAADLLAARLNKTA